MFHYFPDSTHHDDEGIIRFRDVEHTWTKSSGFLWIQNIFLFAKTKMNF